MFFLSWSRRRDRSSEMKKKLLLRGIVNVMCGGTEISIFIKVYDVVSVSEYGI